MACSECGDMPKKCDKDFTKAVIEIENPEQLILFHKVMVPASMGDESQTPVTIGKYHNVLMVYEANGHAYLYSSDGIPSKIAFDSGGILFVENLPDVHQASVGFLYITHTGSAAITNDNEEWVSIGGQGTMDFNLLSNRPKYNNVEMTGDTNIPSVEAETAARINADNTLQTNINNEATARGNADTALGNRITTLDNSLATVAKTGDYDDLIDKPTIGDGVITFTENNVVKGTFSANATENKTIEFPVPTQTSQLTNNGSDGTSTYVETKDMPEVDTTYKRTSNNAIANSTVTNSLDRDVMTNLALDANPSTTTINLNNTKTNLATPSSTTTSSISLPVASSTQAGVMNSATFDAVTNNTSMINALTNGAVAVTGISANPSQADITTAWQTATGLTTLMNRASVYDVTNSKVWTYYTNDTTWHAVSNTTQVTVNTFTNTSEGVIKGSTNTGQVFAENDGTGSVNGWDTLSNGVSTNTSNISSLQTAVAGKQDTLTAGNNITISGNTISADDTVYTAGSGLSLSGNQFSVDNTIARTADLPTVNDATLTIQNDGTTVNTFTANSASNVTANIIPPVKIGSVITPSTTSAYVDTRNIMDNAVTSAKLATDSITTAKITDDAVTTAKVADGAITSDKIDFTTFEYSTGEQTVGKWIDGRNVYKKTIDFGRMASASGKSVAHSITNLGTVIKIDGVVTNGSTTFPLPFVSRSNLGDQLEISVTLTVVEITTNTNYWYDNNFIGHITLYYTKSS